MPPRLIQLRDWLAPGPAEQDEGFHQEILRLSHLGLRVMGGIELIVPLLMLSGRLVMLPQPNLWAPRWWEATALVLAGIGTLAMARAEWSYARAAARPGV